MLGIKLDAIVERVFEFCSDNNIYCSVEDYYSDKVTGFVFSYIQQGRTSPTYEIHSSSYVLSWHTIGSASGVGVIADSIIKYIKDSILKNEQGEERNES